MRIEALQNRVIVELQDPEEETVTVGNVAISTMGQTDGGLYIPSKNLTRAEKPQEGRVIHAGPGRWVGTEWQENEIKKGDWVLFGKFAGQEVDIDGKTYLVMREDEVLGVAEGE